MPYFRFWQSAWLVMVLLAGPAWGQNPNVTVDDQPTAEQRLEEVLQLRHAKRYAEAAELVQELIESGTFKLVSIGQGQYTDADRWARDLLMRDSALRKAYNDRYRAAAARALEQAHAADDRLSALRGVYRRYGVTPEGLSASLTAAGLLLEAGLPSSAAMLVEPLMRHPDRNAQMPRLLMLRGAAAAYRKEQGVFAEVLETLREDAPPLADQLAGLAASIEPARVAVRDLDVDMGQKPMSIRAALWDVPLATAESSPRWVLSDQAATPVLTPAMVLINNGRQVLALDRASGQRVWAYPADDDVSVQKMITAQRWQDDRSIARAGGKILTVLGECHGITQRRNPYVPSNHLLCLDEQTGRPVWQREAGVFAEDEPTQALDRRPGRLNLPHTHFLGTPLISHGKVFVVMRRANSEGDTQSNWLMAYDAADGKLLWYRHLALVAFSFTNADSMRVVPKLTQHGDTIYMSDSLSTVGAIDVNSGGYRWLRVLPVGLNNTKSILAKTRGIGSAPVLTSAGLLVPLSMTSDRLMLVDPEDGSVLRSFEQDPVLNKTEYLLETSAGVLAVSQAAVSFWDTEKAAVAWTFALGAGETMLGRGAVSLRFAVLPTNQRLIVLDLTQGDWVEDAPAQKGSVVLRDGEVVAVSGGRVHAYTSWDRVYQRLVDQVELRPNDPAAGLSLASIAMRQEGQGESVLLGVGHALDAVSRQPIRRRASVASHVFEQLRMLIQQADDASLRGKLYDRLALVTQSAGQEAAYHLDAGLYFAEQGDTQRAVDHLHAVIAERAFSLASYELDGVMGPAGGFAQERLLALIERFGRGIYARQDAMAQARVNELRTAGRLDPSRITALAQRYPLSPLTCEILIEAAQVRAAEGRPIAAASLFKQAVQRAVDDPQRQDAAGQLLMFYIDSGRAVFASDFLNRFTQRHPGLIPTLQGQPVLPELWLERIAGVEPDRVGRVSLAASFRAPELLAGRLVGDMPGSGELLRSRLYLQHENHTISCRAQEQPAEALWSASVPEDSGLLMRLADESGQVLFLAEGTMQVFAFDSLTGEPLWQSSILFDQTDGPAEPGRGGVGPADKLLVAVSETVLCFGHRDRARVLAMDRASGQLLWRTSLEMTALTALDADNWTLAAVGRAGHALQRQSGKLALLSLWDAQPLLGQGHARLALTPLAVKLDQRHAIVIGSTGVMAVEMPTGKTLWSQRLSGQILTGEYAYALHRKRLMAQSNSGEVLIFDTAAKGRPIGAIAVRDGGNSTPTRFYVDGQGVLCLSARGVYRLGGVALLAWFDAIQSGGRVPVNLIVGADHLALIAQSDRAAALNSFTIFIIESEGGRLIEQYEMGPLPGEPQAEDAVRLGRGLAVPMGHQTLVIPPAQAVE